MKKIICNKAKGLVKVLPFYLFTLLPLFSSCSSKEDIIFDHEKQQFETRADRILLEFIAPFGTTTDEEIYITGAFNGGDEAIGNPQYLLEKAANTNAKWGIYSVPFLSPLCLVFLAYKH